MGSALSGQTKKTTFAIDVMGGDNAPDVVLDALELFLLTAKDPVHFILFGSEEVGALLKEKKRLVQCSELRVCEHVLGGAAKPVEVLRQGRDYSMVGAVRAVADGEADAVISAGNTGAYVVAGKKYVKIFDGVDRPCLSACARLNDRSFVLVDVGANLVRSPRLLVQHGVMAVALQATLEPDRRENVCVGVLNLGTEDSKGFKDLRIAREVFRDMGSIIHKAIFVEPEQMFQGMVDVVVSDGFTGNILIKTGAAAFEYALRKLAKSFRAKKILCLLAPLLRKTLLKFKQSLHPEDHHVAMLLGLRRPVMKIHGGCSDYEFAAGVKMAHRLVKYDLTKKIEDNLHILKKHIGKCD